MKKLILFKKNKIKSLDIKNVANMKKRLKNKDDLNTTFNYNISSLYHDIIDKKLIKGSKNEINKLSNANINILKTLSTFAKEEILNNSYDFPKNKRKYISPIKSIDSLTDLKNKLYKNKKRRSKQRLKNINSNISELSQNSHKIKNNHKLIQKFSFQKNKHNHKKTHKRHSVMNIKSSMMSKAFIDEIKEDKLLNIKNISNKNLEMNYEMKTKINYEEFMNEIQIMKINNNLRKDINFIKLKKHIKKISGSFKSKNNNEIERNNSSINNLIVNKNIDKFRILKRKKELYDSLDDEENKDEILGFYLSPDSFFLKNFDYILLFISINYSIFVPLLLSKNYFSKIENNIINYIFIFIDLIYIIDLILNLFKGYNNFYEHLIIKTKKIMRHYIKTWFVVDFLQAIPFYTLFIYNIFSFKFDLDNRFQIIILLKILKLFKMFYYNNNINHLGEIISSNEIIDNFGGFILIVTIIIIILNINACLFIFIGNNSYSGWITKINMQDESFLMQYLASLYFIIVTITTVGYGDITGITYTEIAFQIYLLIIGTIAYSYTISYISNMIIKSNKRSMNFEKNMEIIQEIKLHHPHMNNSLYNEVLRNLYNMKSYEKKDKHVLLDSLPYSMKNKLIISMNKKIINDFIFFKNIDNSDFIVKVVTSLVPIISIKNDIVIQEGNYINEIIFVKKGVVSLTINFDLNNIEYSLNKFFYKNQIGKFNINASKNSNNKQRLTLNNTSNLNLNSSISSKSSSSSEIISSSNNNTDLKIIDIRNNEHFGDALMFLNERSPLNAKIRTKTAELLLLKKLEAIEIYSLYPNIWKRINKISLHNLDQIYIKIKKSVINFAKINNINIDSFFQRKTKIKKDFKNNTKKLNKNSKKVFNEKKPIITEINNDLLLNESKSLKEKSNNQEIKTNMNKNPKNLINTNNIINIQQPNNVSISLIQIGNENFNKADKIIELANKPNIYFPKIKEYFKNPFKIYKEKNLETETRLYEKEEKDYSILPCISKILDETININSNKIVKEKLLYNSFINLKFTKENDFKINSSYENLNILSNNKYIKDINLQLKIKDILKCQKFVNINRNITNLNPINRKMNFDKKFSFKEGLNNNNNIKKGDLTHKNTYNIFSSNDNSKLISQSILPNNNNQYKIFNSSKRLLSFSNLLETNTLKSPNNFQRNINRTKTKKQTGKIKQQLNIISKNIENTSKNINNPEKFYSKFFKNIIDKEKHISSTNNKTPNMRKLNNKSKTNIFKYYLQDNYNHEGNLSVTPFNKGRKNNNK